MKARGFIIIVVALALALSVQFFNTSKAAPEAASGAALVDAPKYSAHQITPTAGQVLHPGQVVKVEWTAVHPRVWYIESCESEVRLSLDGGITFHHRISPWMDSKPRSFYWTVPNLPTNAAVMDIRFGCEPLYPESFSPQFGSRFVIANSGSES